jgi:5-methylcytosine-specific restriction endonuclease McrA
MRRWIATNPAKWRRIHNKAASKYRRKIREQVFIRYGRVCVFCGKRSQLELDHVLGAGKSQAERRAKGSAVQEWKEAIAASPGIFQILCRECNLKKRDAFGGKG